MRTPISVIILTNNEEVNLGHCLESVFQWAQEIIVVDSYSTDATLEIAQRYGARIVQHPFTTQAEQLNWALAHVEFHGEWILRLDADERLTEELKKELQEKLPETPQEVSGLYIKRRVHFMGRWIRHGGYYPTWLLRIWRKGAARAEERMMDEHMVLRAGRGEKTKYDFIDENRKDLTFWVNKHNAFASREAAELLRHEVQRLFTGRLMGASQAERKRWVKEHFYFHLPLFLRALCYFLYRYFIRLGFLDGKEGLIFHFLQGFWYRFLVDAKIYERKIQSTKLKIQNNG